MGRERKIAGKLSLVKLGHCLGSARVSRAGFGVSPKQSWEEVRDGEDTVANTRDACAPQKKINARA